MGFRYRQTKRIVLWIIVLLHVIVIFAFSSEPGFVSSETSGKVTKIVVRLFMREFDQLPADEQASIIALYQHPVRKAAHFLVFASLAFFLMLALAQYTFSNKKTVLLTLLFTAVYALFDEVHQFFVPGRAFSFVDVGIDILGACLGSLVAQGLLFLLKRLKTRGNRCAVR